MLPVIFEKIKDCLKLFLKRVVKVKKNDIQRRMKENLEKNSFTVKKFDESIENVKLILIY